jgi:MoxR-like ATPase
MNYQKYFDTKKVKAQKTVPTPKFDSKARDGKSGDTVSPGGDRRDGLVYVYNDKIELAINVALATRRPMLLRGPSGSGKSSLARNIARRLGWWYYEQVITSRTQARDLQWSFDTLRRLSDAQARQLNKVSNSYIEPGVLWWAFDPVNAKSRGHKGATRVLSSRDPGIPPGNSQSRPSVKAGAVVLLDEIDKADPDVPNNLLVPLGSLQFKVVETGLTIEVKATRPLLMLITTNDERVLPNAFMRRCVVLELEPPDEFLLVEIAKQHFGKDLDNIYQSIAKRVLALTPTGGATARGGASGQVAPSSAEYLDTVRACLELGVNPETNDDAWQAISSATLLKKTSL